MLLDKLKITFTSIILLLCITIACHSLNNDNKSENMKTNNLREIYFAGGCFWGTEHFMKQIKGVKTTEVGYAETQAILHTNKSAMEIQDLQKQ